MKTFITSLSIILASVSPVFAAATNKVFVSNSLIFLFLGFCAAVVVIQLVPAIITLHAMIKAAVSKKEQVAVSVKI